MMLAVSQTRERGEEHFLGTAGKNCLATGKLQSPERLGRKEAKSSQGSEKVDALRRPGKPVKKWDFCPALTERRGVLGRLHDRHVRESSAQGAVLETGRSTS